MSKMRWTPISGAAGFLRTLLTAALTVAAMAPSPADALTPQEIIILARRSDPAGLPEAGYYCTHRGVPRENIILLDLPTAEQIPWRLYQSKVVEPVRATLKRQDKISSARCLLLVGNWPLRIEPDPASAAESRELSQIRDYVGKATIELFQQGWRLEQIARRGESPGRPPTELPKNVRNSYEAEKYYRESLEAARHVIERLPEGKRRVLSAELGRIRQQVEGLSRFKDAAPGDAESPDFQKRLDQWKSDNAQYEKAAAELAPLTSQREPATIREQRRRKQLETNGQIGLLRQLHSDAGELSSGGRTSAFDSELSLLWRDNYPLNGGQPNPLGGKGVDTVIPKGQPPAAMMVARLDGPDERTITRLIDDALAVEKAGQPLTGRFCIDGQGLPETDRRSYDDRQILELADWTKRPKSLTLAKEGSLLAMRSADANPIAFYLGWVGDADASLPAGYQCVRGAVIVSANPADAAQLHGAGAKGWAVGWLKGGAAAVVASVEPTDPRMFVSFRDLAERLFVDGRPLAEAYWSSCRATSWRVILIGDPLYRPMGPPPGQP